MLAKASSKERIYCSTIGLLVLAHLFVKMSLPGVSQVTFYSLSQAATRYYLSNHSEVEVSR